MTNELLFKTNRYPIQNDLFNYFFDNVFADLKKNDNRSHFNPKTDVKELKDAFEITLEVAGLNREDIDVILNNGILEIIGEKQQPEIESDEANIYYEERIFGKFERKFELPEIIQEQEVKASMKNGVLTLILPKKSEPKQDSKRRIEIKLS